LFESRLGRVPPANPIRPAAAQTRYPRSAMLTRTCIPYANVTAQVLHTMCGTQHTYLATTYLASLPSAHWLGA